MGGTRQAPRCRGGRPVSPYPIDRRLRLCARVGTQHLFSVKPALAPAGARSGPESRPFGLRSRLSKAAQPRSSEKNAASRAGQTPCTRRAVEILLTKARKSVTAANRAFEEKQTLSFFTESRDHGGVKTSRSANVELEAAVFGNRAASTSPERAKCAIAPCIPRKFKFH